MKTTAQPTITNLEQFYQEVLVDPVLQEKLKAAVDPDSLCQLAIQLGEEQGYHFTKEEVQAALAIEVALIEHDLDVYRGPVARPYLSTKISTCLCVSDNP